MAVEALQGQLCVLLLEPKGARVNVMGHVGQQEETQHSDNDCHDGVDDKEPPPSGQAVGSLESIDDCHLERARHHGAEGLARVVETHSLGEFGRRIPVHFGSISQPCNNLPVREARCFNQDSKV